MSETSVAGPRGVRDLDPLQPADYRRLFAVLDEVVAVDDIEAFRKALLASLARHFAWTNATIRHELSPGRIAPDGDLLSLARVHSRLRSCGAVALSELRNASEPERLVIERFCRRHDVVDAIVVIIDAEAAGADYLSVAFEHTTGRRERTVLTKLGRQLAPLLRQHLTHHRLEANSASLTKRESQIADLVSQGLSNGEIGAKLHIAVDTVKKHLSHIFAKTGCSSRTQLALSWRAESALAE
jgi:DNA-binding NarL/FixJ family response regulator